MAFNPFSSNDEDSSFERGSPIQQGAKNVVKATATQVQQQQKAFSKALTDQLYGPSTDANNPQEGQVAQKDPTPGMETIQKQMPNDPGNEKQLEETRKKLQELQRQHKEEYYEKTLGDSARKKIQQEEQQKEQEKLQTEEARQQQEAEEKASQEQNLGGIAPQGKTTGRNRMQKPVALTQAKTKTEINRGTTG